MIYVEAYRPDGTQMLGNLDGQTARPTKRHLEALHRGHWPSGQPVSFRAAYWLVVNELGGVRQRIRNPLVKA